MGRFSKAYIHRIDINIVDNTIEKTELQLYSSKEWYKWYNPIGVYRVKKKYILYGFSLKRMLKLYAREQVYFEQLYEYDCNHAWGKQLTNKFKAISDFWWTCRKCGVSTKVLNPDMVSEPLRTAYPQHLR